MGTIRHGIGYPRNLWSGVLVIHLVNRFGIVQIAERLGQLVQADYHTVNGVSIPSMGDFWLSNQRLSLRRFSDLRLSVAHDAG